MSVDELYDIVEEKGVVETVDHSQVSKTNYYASSQQSYVVMDHICIAGRLVVLALVNLSLSPLVHYIIITIILIMCHYHDVTTTLLTCTVYPISVKTVIKVSNNVITKLQKYPRRTQQFHYLYH